MQTRNRMFDDLARMANGAVSTLTGIKGEVEALVRQQIDRLLAEMDVVPRDEFEAVKAVAARARTEQEKLEKRVVELEAAIAGRAEPTAPPAARPAARKAPKRTPARRPRPDPVRK